MKPLWRPFTLAFGALLVLQITTGCGSADHGSQKPGETADIRSEAEAIDGLLSLLVMRDGELVYEGYFDGTKASDLLHLRSATKSVTGLLVGIALAQGHIGSVEDTVGDHLGENVSQFAVEKRAITLQQLLTMTAGLRWDESDNVDEYNRLRRTADPVRHYLSRTLVAEPGARFAYSSGASHLLSEVLTRATGLSTRAFARQHLFGPLGIDTDRWESMGNRVTNGAAGLELAPRDFLKIGELMLAGGQWQGRELLPADWIDEVTHQRVSIAGEPGYGYQWWVQCEPREAWAAMGFGGQTLYVMPALRLVVAANARWQGPGRSRAEQAAEIRRFLFLRLPELLGTGEDSAPANCT